MMLDNIEQNSFKTDNFAFESKMRELNKYYGTACRSQNGYFEKLSSAGDISISKWLGIDVKDVSSENRAAMYQGIRDMFKGVKVDDTNTLGLDKISSWKINKDYKYSNTKQHAGYAAEVISTQKENLRASLNGTGVKTARTDDLAITNPEMGFKVNDQYVDKVRLDSNGNIIERIQTKFVGKNSEECLSKLASKKYEKYLDTSKVDKLEIPSDFYDDVKKLIPYKISKLEEDLKRAKELGKEDVVEKKQAKINKYNQIDKMLEKSIVSSKEAEFAVENPKTYKAITIAKQSHFEDLDSSKSAAMITFTVSTVDNVSKIIDGEIEVDEAVANIVTDTGISAVIEYGEEFAGNTIKTAMSTSSSTLINKVGNTCLPAAVVSFGVESYEDISAFARGEIDGKELAYNLGENAAGIAGSCLGGTIGSAGGPVGTIVGGTIGCAVTVEAYQYAVEVGAKGVEILADKAQELAADVVEKVSETAPEVLNDVKGAFAEFAANINLPFSLG